MPKVFITGVIQQVGIDLLQRNGFDVTLNQLGKDLTREDLNKIVTNYDAVMTMVGNKIDKDVIDQSSSKLRIISNYAVGIDNIDTEACKQKNIVVTNTPGVASESVAEHVFALALACSKFLIKADKFVRDGKYQKWDPNLFLSNQLWGQTIGIIGLGRIGTFVGQIAYGGFKMKILYFDIRRSEDFEMICEAKFSSILDILRNSDIVTLHVPLTEKTKHMISREQLKEMKNSAILINTSRGPVVEEESLVWALKEGEIAAAGLDVYEFEPKISRELLKLENAVLTPHTASATFETRGEMSRIAAQNIIDVFEGREPLGLLRN